jgi:hypothetical protein
MTPYRLLLTTMLIGFCGTAAVARQPAAPATREVRVLVGDQSVFEPGFPVGDISIADPAVADFRMRPGRRTVLLLGIGEGRTRLIMWDQANKGRLEVEVIVETRQQAQAEAKLRGLLRDFPSVKVERVGGDLVVSGSVSSEEDLALIERMASSTGAESFVRFMAPEKPAGAGGRASARPDTAGGIPTGGAGAMEVEYDVQVLEASVTFGSSSYETGIEPSGKVLHSAKVRAPIGAEAQTFIPGKALQSRDIKIDTKELPTSGIRLTLTPDALEDGQLSTRILVETNMPVKSSAYVPGGWRRARWESANDIDAPFSLAGADLLVVPELSTGGGMLSKISNGASMVGGLPGVSSLPGSQYSGSIPYYNKDRKTHLLVLMRARVVTKGQ